MLCRNDVGRALQFLANGKRALLISDTSNAVSALENACQLLGEHYGEAAVECGEAYFYYGKALLELARMESGVLNNVMDGGKSPHLYRFLGTNLYSDLHYLYSLVLVDFYERLSRL